MYWIALMVSMLGSMTAVSTVSAVEGTLPSEESVPVEVSRYGIVGSMTDWGSVPDYPMYEISDNLFEGSTELLPAGEYELKVRAHGVWDESWGTYEYEYDRTFNSQTNVKVTLDTPSYIFVNLDATDDNNQLWPVRYYLVAENGQVSDMVYTGKVDEEPGDEPIAEPSEEPSVQPSTSVDDNSNIRNHSNHINTNNNANTNANTYTNTNNNGKGNSVNTGDSAMPVAVGGVALVALGVTLAVSKKKTSED